MVLRNSIMTLVLTLGLAIAPSLAGSKTVIDDTGRRVRLPARVRRVVCLAPSLTEIVFYLGRGSSLVGVTRFSDYPPRARRIPRIGSYIRINVEAVALARPDLVLAVADGNPATALDKLTRMGLAVFRTRPRSVTDLPRTIVTIGRLLGVTALAKKKAAGLGRRLKALETKLRGQRRVGVFFQIGHRPIVTVGAGSPLNDLIALAGGRNVFGRVKLPYPRLSPARVILARPGVILITCMNPYQAGCRARARYWRRWPSIPAVESHRIHIVESAILNRFSPRLVDGLEDLARLLHPNLGWAKK